MCVWSRHASGPSEWRGAREVKQLPLFTRLLSAQANGWTLAAILPHLEHLNGAAITLDQHTLACKKHGDGEDRQRLAMRIFDEAFVVQAVRELARRERQVLVTSRCLQRTLRVTFTG